MGIIAVGLLLVAGPTAVLVYLARHVIFPRPLPATGEWNEDLAIERYRPMLRLLDRSDMDFLRAQPGFRPEFATRLRRSRGQLFGQYLQSLEIDFGHTCTAIKMLMVQSHRDRPDLASALARSQAAFVYRLIIVRFQLLRYRYGVGTVDVAGLLNLFQGMRIELHALAPAEFCAGA